MKARKVKGPLLAPTPGARALLAKLQALAERGFNGEKTAAEAKLARLLKRYDWTVPDPKGPDLFAGTFETAFEAAPIMQFGNDWQLATAVKQGIEAATPIRCLFRGGELLAQAAPSTANRLHDIAATVAASFGQLWKQFAQAPGAHPGDRGNFIMGLTDGMLDLERKGEQLPSRAHIEKVKRARKKDVAAPAGLALHPYTVAAHLGRQVRFSVPVEALAGQLEKSVKGEIERE